MKTLKTKSFIPSLLVWFSLFLMTGCSTLPKVDPNAPPAQVNSLELLDSDTVYPLRIDDPWEGFNRRVYKFNALFDKYVFLPIVSGYESLTPDLMRSGISNFFSNVREIRNFLNSVLQFKMHTAMLTSVRFAVNTTIGVLGFMDPATGMNLPQRNEDFGQTLGVWGVGPGPYLVLPVLGPSTVRDGIGLGVDWVVETTIREAVVDLETWQIWALAGLNAIDTRYRIAFRYHSTGSPFEYDLVRLLYTRKRAFQVAN
jgi:phospholipid-binding lipoprotein MlaA